MITNVYFVRNREALRRGSLVVRKVKIRKFKKQTKKGVQTNA
jgi:hypothetical protein